MCTMYWTQERKRRRPYRYETVFLSKSGVQQRGKSHGNQVDVHANAKRLSNRPVHERVLMRSTMVGALSTTAMGLIPALNTACSNRSPPPNRRVKAPDLGYRWRIKLSMSTKAK